MSKLQHQDTFQPYYAGREKDEEFGFRIIRRWKVKRTAIERQDSKEEFSQLPPKPDSKQIS